MLRTPRVLAAVRKGLEWVDDAWAAAQTQITEPTVAVGFLQPGGSWGRVRREQAQPDRGLAGPGRRQQGRRRTWARDDLTIALVPGRIATRVTIDVTSTGQRYEFETTMVGGAFNDDLFAELAPPVS